MKLKEKIQLEKDRCKASWQYGLLWGQYKDLMKYPSLLMLRSRQIELLEMLELFMVVYSDLYWVALRDDNIKAAEDLCELIDGLSVHIWNIKSELNVA